MIPVARQFAAAPAAVGGRRLYRDVGDARQGALPSAVCVVRTVSRGVPIVIASFTLCGCERVPSVNVFGTFFPSWMLCILVGIALTLVARWALAAIGLEPWIGPRGLVYPALALAFTLATWLAFFRG